ncbi:MAG TPA: hypothetical protein VG206_10190 [Terriglobia bacterium]|nr:hypothetical protein [Terriglobia bacterium]
MKDRGIRLIILLWLGWYLSGPVCETLDRWDGPRQELSDILFHAGGGLVVLAAAALVGPRLLKRLREAVVQSFAPNQLWQFSACQRAALLLLSDLPAPAPANSPPVPLRI